MSGWLPWVLPPLVGAMIGYVTNALAIRMLFRPFRERRIFGIRVPFTPGVIPRQRADLAERIGRMVSRQLLTPEVFDKRFASEAFARALRRAGVAAVDRLAGLRLAQVDAALAVDTLVPLVFQHGLGPLFRQAGGLVDELAPLLRRQVARARPLTLLQSGESSALLGQLWPRIELEADRLLHSPAVRAELHARARNILRYSLDQLTSVQRLFVSAGQYDRQLESRLPAIIDRSITEILQTLHEPRTRAAVITRLERWIEEHHDDSTETLIGGPGLDVIEDAIRRLLADPRRLSALIGGEQAQDVLRALIRAQLNRNADRRLGDLLPVLVQRRAVLGRWIADRGQTVLTRVSGQFLEQLDVHGLVVERINDLDIREVEGLLLAIIRRHLQWINMFGALLGALIGGVQILLTQF